LRSTSTAARHRHSWLRSSHGRLAWNAARWPAAGTSMRSQRPWSSRRPSDTGRSGRHRRRRVGRRAPGREVLSVLAQPGTPHRRVTGGPNLTSPHGGSSHTNRPRPPAGRPWSAIVRFGPGNPDRATKEKSRTQALGVPAWHLRVQVSTAHGPVWSIR
jgi:hypothetical protein